MEKTLQLTISGRIFTAKLIESETVKDLLTMLPLKMTLQKYAGHEYYGRLKKKPTIKNTKMTSDAYAGGIYYYDGWGAFTVLYGDAHIAPFEVVHIGNVNEDISTFLRNSGETLEALIEFVE